MTDQTIQITRTITRDEFANEMTQRLHQAMLDELTRHAEQAGDEERDALSDIRSLLQTHPDGTVVDGAVRQLVIKALASEFNWPRCEDVDEGVPL